MPKYAMPRGTMFEALYNGRHTGAHGSMVKRSKATPPRNPITDGGEVEARGLGEWKWQKAKDTRHLAPRGDKSGPRAPRYTTKVVRKRNGEWC